MKIKLFFYIFIILFSSCKSVDNIQDPYKNMTILDYGHNTAYAFQNTESDKLIIYIDGTGWTSVLGWKENNRWTHLGFSNFVVNTFRSNYNVMIPERLNMQIGRGYRLNPDMRRNYNLENLVEYYSFAINISMKEIFLHIEIYPEVLGEIMGYTYIWWNDFLDYRPFDYYGDINIPVLFVHGKSD